MVDGQLMHEYVHDQQFRESRGNCLTVRGLAIHLAELHKDSAGTPRQNRKGLWLPYPVEYKQGNPKEGSADELQLCTQAMCLEEIFCCIKTEDFLHMENGAAIHRQRQEKKKGMLTQPYLGEKLP